MLHPSASNAPSTAKVSAPVDRRVLWLGLCTTPTVVEWTVVEGRLTVGVVETGTVVVGAVVGVVLGTVAVGVVVGATVPGWAPPTVAVAGVVEAGLVLAGAGVVDVVMPCTRADAGIGIPRARSVPLVVLAPKAKLGLTARQLATAYSSTFARA
jgi:hypothetical protein